MQFLKYVLATFVGLMLFAMLSVFFFFIFASLGGDGTVNVADKSILTIKLNAPIAEIGEEDPFEDLGLNFSSPVPMGLNDIRKNLEKAAMDERIDGIYLNITAVSTGFATLHEIKTLLEKFKETGKFIIAYSEIYTEGAYYLASVADEVYINPNGFIEFDGLSNEQMFLKGMFEKLEVQPEIFRVGDFKSAVEPFIQDKMSEANRLQTRVYMDSLYHFYLQNVSEARSVPYALLQEASFESAIQDPVDAIQYKLVTDTAYYDQVITKIKERQGKKEDDKLKFISMSRYKKAVVEGYGKFARNKIAVLVAEGNIVSGSSSDGNIGSATMVKEIRKLRNNDNVKAVVLRINSPGGSALASDVMWRELELLKAEKPLIASMSDVAASGGYYIAMGCDKIMAQPNTITGSIGVFSILVDAHEMFNNKLGITFDGVKTGEFSNVGSPTKPFSDGERAIIQKGVERVYETFTQKVANGRGLTVDSVKSIASGRVWTGMDAKNNGLVDELGDLEDAVKLAAELAEMDDDYQVRYYPPKKDILTRLLENQNSRMKTDAIKTALGDLYPLHEQFQRLQQLQNGPQMLLPVAPYVMN